MRLLLQFSLQIAKLHFSKSEGKKPNKFGPLETFIPCSNNAKEQQQDWLKA